jgi:uncharacterized membrane protein YecN with MAPEG domain
MIKEVQLYASLLGLFFVFLSIRTIGLRRKLKIALGDSGNKEMLRAIRVHSNFAEYVPLGLMMIYFSAIQGASQLFIHFVGICLLVGRLSHAYGVSHENEHFKFRVAGMIMTFTTYFLTSVYLLFSYFGHWTEI